MDKKKSILIIILVLIMALVVALMIQPKRTTPLELKDNQKEGTIFESSTTVNEEDIKEEPETVNEEKIIEEKASVNKQENKNTTKVNSTTNLDTPTFEKLEVKEEINKLEEASISFDDPGIINDNGVIVVTRDFKLKSPRKYSFKDFGVLAEPPVR